MEFVKMVAPVYSAILMVVLENIAATVGKNIGEVVSRGILGKNNDLKEIRNLLKEMDLKLNGLLILMEKNYNLLQKIPYIIYEAIDENELYKARNLIESHYRIFTNFEHLNSSIDHNSYTEILSSWQILIDKENDLKSLVNLPKYAEFILVATEGKLFDFVKDGLERKIKIIADVAAQFRRDVIDVDFSKAENILSSDFVASSNFIHSAPWITWVMKPARNKEEYYCLPGIGERLEIDIPFVSGGATPNSPGSKDYCIKKIVDDKIWRNNLNNTSSSLEVLKNKLVENMDIYLSTIFSVNVLSNYMKSLDGRFN